MHGRRFPVPSKPGILLGLLIVLVAARFWLGSRYPAIDEKAAMAGDALLEDVLSFEAKLPVADGDPAWRRIAVSTLNWCYTNKEGMTFGVLLATLILAFLRVTPRRRSRSVFFNTFKGTFLGAPLGVCVNCAAPIGKGLYQGGAAMETSLAALLSSPTLNILVVAMSFSVLPFYMAVSKVTVTFLLLLVILPLLVKYVFRRGAAPAAAPAGDAVACAREDETPSYTWGAALVVTARELWRSFWFILLRTVPLMLVAGFLGVTVATLVPLEALTGWKVTLGSLAVVAAVGTFLPVPMAFDVVVVQALLLGGLSPELGMALLVTLGSFSIYPFFILWNTMSRRVALVLFSVITLLGVGSGYFARGFESYQVARSKAMLEERFAGGAPLDPPLGRTSAGAGGDRRTRDGGDRTLPGSDVVYEGPGVRIEAVGFAARPAPAAGEPGFSRRGGSAVGIESEPIMLLDFLLPFSQGRGIASGDFDHDGWADLALAERDGVGLYRNLGNGRLARVPTPRADHPGTKLVAFVDIDGDGWLDLYLGAFGDADYFLLNDRCGFERAETVAVPHLGALFTEAVSFADLDRDADLDFVKGHWFFLLPRTAPSSAAANYLVRNQGLAFEQTALDEIVGETLTALFTDFNADGEPDLVVGNDFTEPDIYYVGEGGGRLRQLRGGESVPISTLATMSVDTGDVDNDLVPDLYLTGKTSDFSTRRDAARAGEDDLEPRQLRIRQRNREFDERYCAGVKDAVEQGLCRAFLDKREIARTRRMSACKTLPSEAEVDECMVAVQLLLAHSTRERQLCELLPEGFPVQRRMCDAYVDYFESSEPKVAGDKYLDRGAIDQAMQGNVLLRGSSDGKFTNQTREMGVYDGGWSWNAKFADLDNDEWQDLYVVNGWWLEGRVYPKKFFRNHQGERFVAEEAAFGLDSGLKESSYTYFDLDNDGDLDIASRAMHGTVDLYVNNERRNHRVIFELRDRIGNRFGIGTKVYLHYGPGGTRHQVREIKAGSGYLSFDAPLAHFGLGAYSTIDRIEIAWSTGERTIIDQSLPADARYVVVRDQDARLTSTAGRRPGPPSPAG